jgi:hypothetical protein
MPSAITTHVKGAAPEDRGGITGEEPARDREAGRREDRHCDEGDAGHERAACSRNIPITAAVRASANALTPRRTLSHGASRTGTA